MPGVVSSCWICTLISSIAACGAAGKGTQLAESVADEFGVDRLHFVVHEKTKQCAYGEAKRKYSWPLLFVVNYVNIVMLVFHCRVVEKVLLFSNLSTTRNFSYAFIFMGPSRLSTTLLCLLCVFSHSYGNNWTVEYLWVGLGCQGDPSLVIGQVSNNCQASETPSVTCATTLNSNSYRASCITPPVSKAAVLPITSQYGGIADFSDVCNGQLQSLVAYKLDSCAPPYMGDRVKASCPVINGAINLRLEEWSNQPDTLCPASPNKTDDFPVQCLAGFRLFFCAGPQVVPTLIFALFMVFMMLAA